MSTLRDTANWLQNACDKLNELVREPWPRPIDMTVEQKETQARLNGYALMYKNGEVYAMNVRAQDDPGQPKKGWYKEIGFTTTFKLMNTGPPLLIQPVWSLIYRENSFNHIK